jgi:hypothetical protein
MPDSTHPEIIADCSMISAWAVREGIERSKVIPHSELKTYNDSLPNSMDDGEHENSEL